MIGIRKELKKMKLKLMTFNICHCEDYEHFLKTKESIINLEKFGSYIKSMDRDIIGLNEVRDFYEPDPEYLAEAKILGELTGRNHFFAKAINMPGPYGNGFLCKYPIKACEVIPIPDPEVKDEDVYYETRCLLKATVDIGKDITVFVSHFGLAKKERINAVKTIVEEVKKVDTPVILMGDFNEQPNGEILAPLYEIFNEAFSKDNTFTFPSNDPCVKIDYIFLSKDIKVLSSEVKSDVVSDHCAVLCDIEI